MARPGASEWASYREPAGDGAAFCGNLTATPPPWAGRWRRVQGGWYREAAADADAPPPEPQSPRPQADAVRSRRQAYERRRRATPERRRYMREFMRSYLPAWRAKHPRRIDPCRVGLRWARGPGDVLHHLVPTVGDRRFRPRIARHCICEPWRNVRRWTCPLPCGRLPDALKCPTCLLLREGWFKLVSDEGPKPAPATPAAASSPIARQIAAEAGPTQAVRASRGDRRGLPHGVSGLVWSEGTGLVWIPPE